jgi:glycine/sarcosine N-methyltransferase
MNNPQFYDQFADDYDRFVNWEARLVLEVPFLKAQLASISRKSDQKNTILDAACGTGQHLIALVEQGFEGVGADFSSQMIAIAKANAEEKKLDIPFKQASFGQLVDTFGKNSFDGLICLGNSLPHVLQDRAMDATLTDFKRVLRPGSKIIIQNRNFDQIMQAQNRWMDPQTHREGSKTWIFYRFYDFEADGLITFNFVTLFSARGEEPFQQRIVSTRLRPWNCEQMVNFLRQAGFGGIQRYGDLQGTPFDAETSGNLVLIARA